MNRGTTATRLLALGLALALCMLPALAQGPEDREAPPQPAQEAEERREDSAGAPAPTSDEPAGSDEAPASDEHAGGTLSASALHASRMDDELVFTGENDFRSLKFQDLKDRVLEGNLTALMLEESIASIDAIDYTKMYTELSGQLGSIERAQDIYASIPVATVFEGMMQSYVISNLQSSYGSISSAVDDLATGKLQKDYASAKRQLENTRNLMVVGAESLYLSILELEQSQQTLRRNLSALDRSEQEMSLRYDLGQISALTLEQVKSGRANLQSSANTLNMNLRSCKLQMQAMIGSSLTGSLVLSEPPEISEGLLNSMDYQADLSAAKELSYDLFAAREKLKQASDTYDDAQAAYDRNSYSLRSARHTYESAKYEYQAAVQSFEMNFRKIFDSVEDYRQILAASQTTLAFQESSYAASELKYRQGTLSQNALLDAADDLAEAKEAVASAKRNLFTAFRAYTWAVTYGVING